MPPRTTSRKRAAETSAAWRGIPLVRPAALDLFCCGGGAGRGLVDAGYKTVVGIDAIDHRTSYQKAAPGVMRFVLGDVLDLTPDDLRLFDLVWASPPCQAFCRMIPTAQREKHQAKWNAKGKHLDLIPQTRALLKASGRPYIIENVPDAPLNRPIKLCGTMFGLNVFRHRMFESNVALAAPCECDHRGKSTSGLARAVRQPRTEKEVAPCDLDHLPEGVEMREVEYPCRQKERSDYIYVGTTPEMERLFRQTYGRKYCRSLKELWRIMGNLVEMDDEEKRAEVERYHSERTSKLQKSGDTEMFTVVGATSKFRGTTEEWQGAMKCDWLTNREELTQAVPPAYSECLGRQVLAAVG